MFYPCSFDAYVHFVNFFTVLLIKRPLNEKGMLFGFSPFLYSICHHSSIFCHGESTRNSRFADTNVLGPKAKGPAFRINWIFKIYKIYNFKF